jgi:hypothetical protein
MGITIEQEVRPRGGADQMELVTEGLHKAGHA